MGEIKEIERIPHRIIVSRGEQAKALFKYLYRLSSRN
jgi:hypothetical protein